jgi:uncharacterized protein (DUF952 family)
VTVRDENRLAGDVQQLRIGLSTHETSMTSIYHLAPSVDIDRAARTGQYAPDSLSTEGFIHCSYAHQVQAIADSVFREASNLVLLEIDPTRVTSRIAESASGDVDAYPHIYGPLPMNSVLSVRELRRSFDGRFEMPCTVTGNCACKATDQ